MLTELRGGVAMGWKFGLAGVLLAAGVVAQASAIEPGAAYGSFEGRDYLIVWPSSPPSRLVVYFHASGPQPLAYEARSGMLEALAADAGARGYALLAPTSGRGGCQASGAAPVAEMACWRLDAVDDEIARLDRLVAFIQQINNVTFRSRDAVGYELGAELLLAGFGAGRLSGYGRLGLLDAEPPVSASAMSATPANGPLVYLEAPEGDEEGAADARDLLRALVDAEYGQRLCVRGSPGDSRYDGARLASFLSWFDVDCRALAPVAPPRRGSGGGSPPVVGEPVARGGESGDRAVTERRGPRG